MPSGRSVWPHPHPVCPIGGNQLWLPWNPPLYIDKSTFQQLEDTSHRSATSVRHTQFRTTAGVQFRRISLDPAPDRELVDGHISLNHKLLEVSKAETIPQIPTDTHENDLSLEMTSLELRWPVPSHSAPAYQTARSAMQHNRFVYRSSDIRDVPVAISAGCRGSPGRILDRSDACPVDTRCAAGSDMAPRYRSPDRGDERRAGRLTDSTGSSAASKSSPPRFVGTNLLR